MLFLSLVKSIKYGEVISTVKLIQRWTIKGVVWFFLSTVFPFLYFDLTLSSQNLLTPVYSVYQQSLYNNILSLREKGMNYVQIADWLNRRRYKTPRGRFFRNNHVHSIAKKRKRRLEIIDTKPTVSISNINFKFGK